MSESKVEPEYLSVAQVARRLGCSVSLVQKWRRLGWLVATRLGPPDVPVYGYRLADVERFASERWNRQRGRPALAGVASVAGDPQPAPGLAPPATAGADEAPPRLPPAGGHGRPERFTPTQLEPVETSERASERAGRPTLPAIPSVAPSTAASPADLAPSETSGGGMPPAVGHGAGALPAPVPSLNTTGRPLVLWAGDPRQGMAMILARFAPDDLTAALDLAARWARRYDELSLGEAAGTAEVPNVLVRWSDGKRLPPGDQP